MYRLAKNRYQEIQIFTQRAGWLAGLMAFCALILIGRLFYLQVIQHSVFETLSWHNQVNIQPIAPNRGLIMDRYGRIMAENTPIYNLMITPYRVANLNATINALAKILPIGPNEREQFEKARKQHHHFDPIPILTHLNEAQVARFMVDQFRYPGVEVKVQLARYYPYGASTAHLLGYVGRIDERDLARINKNDYQGTDYIGKLGLEKFYEDRLHGQSGFEAVETDAGGKAIQILKHDSPVPGQNLLLSIDLGLQLTAIEAMTNHRGAVVALDPRNGEILALVSQPGFDPNVMARGVQQSLYQQWRNSPEQPLYNRAIRGQYPLASTIKPFVAIKALSENVIQPEDSIHDPGWFRLPNVRHVYHDWDKDGHGVVNLARAILVSCDTYFFQLGVKLGITRIGEILSQFGFGDYTFIDMHEELPGLIPTPEWKKKHTGQQWYLGDTVAAAIGQGYLLTTPLQLANAAAIMANRGMAYQPHLLRGTVALQREKIFPSLPGQRVVTAKAEHWDLVHEAMTNVVKTPGGTAYGRFGPVTYTVAGKTGTAQVFNLKNRGSIPQSQLPEFLRDHSLFIAFAPTDKPIIALAVVVENDKVAAPIVARKIIDFYLNEHGLIPPAQPIKVQR